MPIDAKKHPATHAVFTLARKMKMKQQGMDLVSQTTRDRMTELYVNRQMEWDRALELAMGNTPLTEIKA